jgi:hypothetical protein
MVLLCRRHHRIVHRCELRITPELKERDDGVERLKWRFADSRGAPLGQESRALRPDHQRRRLDTERRRTGDGDPLTAYGLDVTISAWLAHADELHLAA